MKNKLRASSEVLLACFFDQCESQFRFLERRHGYSRLGGLVEYHKGRQIITPYRGEEIPGHFLAVMRYEKDRQAVEILYGDREFVIEGFAYYDQVYRLALSEILSAVKKTETGRTRYWLVTQEELLQDSVQSLAKTFKKHWRHFLRPPAKVIDRALTIRSKRMEQAIREQYKKDIGDASREAARAFLEKDFIAVIALLTPYEADLSAGDAKKLTLARRKLLESA